MPLQLSTFEEFVAGLRERVPAGASKADVQIAAQHLRNKTKFRKLASTEIDAAIDIVRQR
jgi:hypothetical protein